MRRGGGARRPRPHGVEVPRLQPPRRECGTVPQQRSTAGVSAAIRVHVIYAYPADGVDPERDALAPQIASRSCLREDRRGGGAAEDAARSPRFDALHRIPVGLQLRLDVRCVSAPAQVSNRSRRSVRARRGTRRAGCRARRASRVPRVRTTARRRSRRRQTCGVGGQRASVSAWVWASRSWARASMSRRLRSRRTSCCTLSARATAAPHLRTRARATPATSATRRSTSLYPYAAHGVPLSAYDPRCRPRRLLRRHRQDAACRRRPGSGSSTTRSASRSGSPGREACTATVPGIDCATSCAIELGPGRARLAVAAREGRLPPRALGRRLHRRRFVSDRARRGGHGHGHLRARFVRAPRRRHRSWCRRQHRCGLRLCEAGLRRRRSPPSSASSSPAEAGFEGCAVRALGRQRVRARSRGASVPMTAATAVTARFARRTGQALRRRHGGRPPVPPDELGRVN